MTGQVGTPMRADARDNRERIVATARVVFAAEGLDVPIREIARRAQVGVATLYRHFPTKEALLATVLEERMALCSAIVQEGLAAADPWQGFCQVIEELMRVHALDRGFSRAFTAPPPEVVPYLAADRDRTLRMMGELIRRAKKSGALRADLLLEPVSEVPTLACR